MSVPAVNSALQRARATLASKALESSRQASRAPLDADGAGMRLDFGRYEGWTLGEVAKVAPARGPTSIRIGKSDVPTFAILGGIGSAVVWHDAEYPSIVWQDERSGDAEHQHEDATTEQDLFHPDHTKRIVRPGARLS